MEIFDISQTLKEGIPVWPGDPELRFRWASRVRDGGSSNVGAVDMGVHTGTHVDAPLHLFDSGGDVGGIPIENFLGPARVRAIGSKERIRAKDLEKLDWRGVKRVLFKTNPQDLRWYICLDEGAAEFLVRRGMLLVGTDAPSVDPFDSETLTAHRILLGSGVVLLEGACLEKVPPGDYELICLPLKLAGLDGSPVRAVLVK